MAAKNQGGQRGNITSASGKKARSPTSTSHKGSRVEPSHVHEKQHAEELKAAAKKKASKKS
jgi:hypothetical protein